MVLTTLTLVGEVTSTAPSVGADWLTPAFMTALAGVIAAIATLIVAIRATNTVQRTQATVEDTQKTVDRTHGAVAQVAVQTNGTISALQARIAQLEGMMAGRRAVPSPEPSVTPPATLPPADG